MELKNKLGGIKSHRLLFSCLSKRIPLVTKGLGVFLVAILVLTSCQTLSIGTKAPLTDDGEVYLYAQPFPQEAGRLSFKIDVLLARRADGIEFPFSLKLASLRGKELTRQRLLGTAQLPPGAYVGFSIGVRDARVQTEDGEAILLTSPEPTKLDFPFSVSRKRAYVFSLDFQPRESGKTGYSFSPTFLVSIPPKSATGLTGYASNSGSNDVTVFDKRSGQVIGVIAVPGSPAGIALDGKGLKAYVAIPNADAISVIDVIQNDASDRVELHVGDRPRELALSPDGKILLVANVGSNTVSVIDTVSLSETGRVVVGSGPSSVLVDSANKRAYIFCAQSSSVSVIDMANRSLVATVATDAGPLRGQFNRQGDRLYVIHEWSPYLSVVDTKSLSVAKRLSIGMGVISIKVDSITDLVYLGKAGDPLVGVYEPFSFVPVDYVRVGGSAGYLTIDGEGNSLIAVDSQSRKLVITSLIGKKMISAIDVGEVPYQVAVMGER
jgi:YVTN family beta-propeller protein